MRRHPDRLSTTDEDFVLGRFQRRPGLIQREMGRKRGPKNRQKRWPLLNYTIKPGVGVVFKEEA